MHPESLEEIDIESIFEEEMVNDIKGLNTKLMQNISNSYRQTLRQTVQLKKVESIIQFDKNLNADLLINKLISQIQEVKLGLNEILEPEHQIIENQKTKHVFQILATEIPNYKKTLLLRQAQLGSLSYIIDYHSSPDFLKNYTQTYNLLKKYAVSPNKASPSQINYYILENEMEWELQLISEWSDCIQLIKLSIVHDKYINYYEEFIKSVNRLKVMHSKVITIAEIFPYACMADQKDLFSYEKTDKRWQRLFERYIVYKIYGQKKKIQESFDLLKQNLNFVNATMSIIHKAKNIQKNTLTQIVQSTGKILKCAIFKKNARYEAQMLISDPNGQLAKDIWNLPEQKMFRSLISAALPYIEHSEQIFIPRIFTEYLDKNGKTHLPEMLIKDVAAYTKQIVIRQQYEQKLLLRINSPYTLKKVQDPQPNNIFNNAYNSVASLFKKQPKVPEAIIYHIHGGGFISMSSFIHQTYTRIWANNLDTPIVSVDYGKAPENPYPQGLYDCFEGFMWVLYCFRQVYQVEPKKIILVGDSAGGNLVAALTNLLISYKLPRPEGVVLVYPALNLNYWNYTPSLLTSLNDMILPHTFLKICLQFYLKKQNLDPEHDSFISPIKASDNILKEYPPTRIFVGSRDPFHDDCCRFVEKLNQMKKNVASLMIFEEFPHGFLQFDLKTQPHEQCRKAIKEVQNALQELIKKDSL